jgi:hypothetical protein
MQAYVQPMAQVRPVQHAQSLNQAGVQVMSWAQVQMMIQARAQSQAPPVYQGQTPNLPTTGQVQVPAPAPQPTPALGARTGNGTNASPSVNSDDYSDTLESDSTATKRPEQTPAPPPERIYSFYRTGGTSDTSRGVFMSKSAAATVFGKQATRDPMAYLICEKVKESQLKPWLNAALDIGPRMSTLCN